VLLVPGSRGLVLPNIHVNPDQRLPEQINGEMLPRFGVKAHCLFPLPSVIREAREDALFEVMECLSEAPPQPPSKWTPIESPDGGMAREEQRSAIRAATTEISAHRNGTKLGPFARLGWMEDLLSWAQRHLSGSKIHLTGAFQQIDAHPEFALVRLQTDGPAFWFKAVGEPNVHEFSITIAISNLFSRFVPELIATRAEWNGWLSQEVAGKHLSETSDAADWTRAAATLGELQTESIESVDRLLNAGCRDLRCEALQRSIDPFMSFMAELMEQQSKAPPAPVSKRELRELSSILGDAIQEWEHLRVPNSIGHLDLNPENLLVSQEGCVFLDWAEAYVGAPFLTFEYLGLQAARVYGNAATLSSDLRECYLQRWRPLVPGYALARACELAPILAVFAYAAGTQPWRNRERIDATRVAGYLRSLTRRMYRDAKKLSAHSSSSSVGDVS
jgi:Phosphotransferase enzyme family